MATALTGGRHLAGIQVFDEVDLDKVVYIGVSEESVEIHFEDMSLIRISNPDFFKGLNIRRDETGGYK